MVNQFLKLGMLYVYILFKCIGKINITTKIQISEPNINVFQQIWRQWFSSDHAVKLLIQPENITEGLNISLDNY